jgi:hypothetical protein
MPLLNPGDQFPRLTITATDGQPVTVPDAFAGDFTVVLFYRGSWCPYCNAQLRAFERAAPALAATSTPNEGASPPSADATAKPSSPVTNVHLRPSRSPSLPPRRSRLPAEPRPEDSRPPTGSRRHRPRPRGCSSGGPHAGRNTRFHA